MQQTKINETIEVLNTMIKVNKWKIINEENEESMLVSEEEKE